LVPVVAAVGAGVVVVLAAASGATWRDGLVLVAISLLGAGIAVGAGWAVGRKVRSAGLAVQAAVVAVTAVVATLLGVVLAAQAMFVSTRDLGALLVVIAAAGTAATLAALVLADRLGRASTTLLDLSQRLEADPTARVDDALPAELAEVASQMVAARDRLDLAQARERAMEASRRELVAWVSHDLRTPLAGIRAMVEALEDGVVADPQTVARYHTSMRREADRLTQLVDDLFELSRIQAGAMQLTLERVGLADLVSDAIAATGVVADARGVVLEGELRDPRVEVDASVPDISRVLRNLLDNAIRHTPRGGAVRVEVGAEGDHAVLCVHDACGGIPDQELDRVFDLAFRGDEARTPGDRGGGLGLAIARGLVEAHDGDIAVANVGSGCCFTIRLPLER
jgi:signal transduction histidine kinase